MPLLWRTEGPVSKVKSHLPVEELANRAHPLLGTLTFAPLAAASLLPEADSLPPHYTIVAAYRALRGQTRQLLLVE